MECPACKHEAPTADFGDPLRCPACRMTYIQAISAKGAKPGKKTIGTIPGLIVIAAATFLIFKFFGVDSGTSEKASAKQSPAICGSEGMAYVMSQNFVKQQLKAPASAKFPYRASAQNYLGDCRHAIVGTVDSQNSFGAMLRSTYSVTMVYLPDQKKWRADDLTIQ